MRHIPPALNRLLARAAQNTFPSRNPFLNRNPFLSRDREGAVYANFRNLMLAILLLVSAAPAQRLASVDSVFGGAIVSLKAANYEQAEAGFRTVVGLEPDRLRGYLGVVQVFMAQRKTAEALEYLRGEAERLPDRIDLRVVIGDTAVRAVQYDVASSEFNAVLSWPEAAALEALNVPRGAAAGTLLRDPAADPQVESLQILTVRDATPKGAAGIHLRLAEIMRVKEDHSGAIAEWEKLSLLLPNTAWILANLGLEQEAGGKPIDAMKSYRASLALMSGNAVVLNNLAFLVAEHGGDLYEALRYARRAEILMPGSLDVLDTEGWISLKQGYFDDAVGTFLRLVRRQPGRMDFRKHLAESLTKRGVHSPAADDLIKSLNAPMVAGDDEKILQLLDGLGK